MRRRRSLGPVLIGLLLLTGLFVTCGRREQERPEVAPQDPLWSQFISAHTSGLVSKKAKIRVLFASDVIDQDKVGETPGSVLRIDPLVDGSLTFSSPREIVLVPDQDLESGRHYRVTIEARGLDGIPAIVLTGPPVTSICSGLACRTPVHCNRYSSKYARRTWNETAWSTTSHP